MNLACIENSRLGRIILISSGGIGFRNSRKDACQLNATDLIELPARWKVNVNVANAIAEVGYLCQGQFKGILIQKESHFLELCRYVVLNPVR